MDTVKFNLTTTIVGVGLLVALWAATRNRASASNAATTHNAETSKSPGQWWSYAGKRSGTATSRPASGPAPQLWPRAKEPSTWAGVSAVIGSAAHAMATRHGGRHRRDAAAGEGRQVNAETIIKTLAGVAAGVVLGWSGSALTLQGRVHALEDGQRAIILRLDALITAKGVTPPAEAAKP